MNPLDIIEPLWYALYVAHDFIGNLLMSILAISFAILIMYFIVKLIWSVLKFVCKPIILIIGAVVAFVMLA